jgi:hypothetical protein
MEFTKKTINTILTAQDIEGLVAAGGNAYEYADEAEIIALALSFLDDTDLTPGNVQDILTEVWAESFDLDDDAVALRTERLQKAATAILVLKDGGAPA